MMRVGRCVLFFMKDIILMVGFTVNKNNSKDMK